MKRFELAFAKKSEIPVDFKMSDTLGTLGILGNEGMEDTDGMDGIAGMEGESISENE